MTNRLVLLAALLAVLAGGKAAAEEIRGVIEKVDPAKGELVLEGRGRGVRGQALSFTLARDTQIVVGRQEAAVADLKPGARAVILYDTKNGQRIARSITVRGTLKKAEPAKAEPNPVAANTVAGTIGRISFTERELVVISPGPQGTNTETLLVVPENASITRAKKAIKLDDIREGETVVARTTQRDGKTVVASMEVGVQPMTAQANERLERVRTALKAVDFFLQRMGQRKAPPEP